MASYPLKRTHGLLLKAKVLLCRRHFRASAQSLWRHSNTAMADLEHPDANYIYIYIHKIFYITLNPKP